MGPPRMSVANYNMPTESTQTLNILRGPATAQSLAFDPKELTCNKL